MKRLAVGAILLLSFVLRLMVKEASAARGVVSVPNSHNNETTGAVHDAFWLLHQKLEEDLELQWKQLEEDLTLGVEQLSRHVERQVIEFAGEALGRTSTRLQAAHLAWISLHKTNATRGVFDPWLKDAIAGIVGFSIFSRVSGKSVESSVDIAVPLLSIAMALGRSTGIIIRYYEDEVTPRLRRTLQLSIAAIGTSLVYISPLPLQLVAAAIAGASLMFESFITELVGQWFYMFESMPPGKRRGILQQAYRKLQQKFLYPVRSAFEQIRMASYTETPLEPSSTREKVNDAIYHSYQVRTVWACASAGIGFQLLLNGPLERVANGVRSWCRGRRRDKAIKGNKSTKRGW